MADTNRLVSLIALVIAGLIIAAWGAIYIWLNRNDQLVISTLRANGALTLADAARLTNPTWIWILSIVQIIIGLILIAWGIFQYFAKPEDVVVFAKGGVNAVKGGGTTVITTKNGSINGSRRVYATEATAL